jgi:vancomycin aglycone glucosyltransferase
LPVIEMRVVLSTHGLRGDIEPMAKFAVELPTLDAEVRGCAPPDCPALTARVSVSRVPIGVRR